jgi:predicted ribosomally synthesized peptide with nif11-like leader
MTQQSAKQFIEKTQKDPNFNKKVSQVKNKEEMQKILKENGFSFTKEEYKTAAKSVFGKEMTEKELANISGGPAAGWLQD